VPGAFPWIRRRSAPPEGDAGVGWWSDAQHGPVSHAQALACGLTAQDLHYRVRTGRLHRYLPRVYVPGHVHLDQRGRAIAALLFGGEGAVLSHVDAAELHGLLAAAERARVDVTLPSQRRPTRRVRVHVSPSADRVIRAGLPLTSVARTILDLADTSSERQVEQALNQAQLRRRLDLDHLAATLAAANGRRGTGRLERALRHHREAVTITRSQLEEAFLAFLRAHRLPPPEVNRLVRGYRADFLWRDRRLIAETDGLRAHKLPGAFEHDRRRDRVHRRAGYVVERFTWGDVTRRRRALAAELRPRLGPV
jgi:very-short-patch-repair endonuclease